MTYQPLRDLRRRRMYPNYREHHKDRPFWLAPREDDQWWDWYNDAPYIKPDYSKPEYSTPDMAPKAGEQHQQQQQQTAPPAGGTSGGMVTGGGRAAPKKKPIRGAGLSGTGVGRYNGGSRNAPGGRRPM
jgi:hypothetical protein